MRAAPEISLKIGQVVHDENNDPWVFCSYLVTTQSHQLYFVKVSRPDWTYHATHRATLVRKFPDILSYELEDAA